MKPGLESSMFKWKDWDQMNTMQIMFYDITLNQDIGEFKKGDKFKWATIDFQTSVLQIGLGNQKYKDFSLGLRLIEQSDASKQESEVAA